MADLGSIFNRIMDENESMIRHSFDDENTDRIYPVYDTPYYSAYTSGTNNIYVSLMTHMKAKIDDFDNLNSENDMDEKDTCDKGVVELCDRMLNDVDEFKKLITYQHDRVSMSEKKYNEHLNKLTTLYKALLDLSEIKYETHDSEVNKSEVKFNSVLSEYINSIQQDSLGEELKRDYTHELRLFKKYTNMSRIVIETQQIPICILCMEKVPSHAYQCGHVCCETCMSKDVSGKCHTCREPIQNKIKLFLY